MLQLLLSMIVAPVLSLQPTIGPTLTLLPQMAEPGQGDVMIRGGGFDACLPVIDPVDKTPTPPPMPPPVAVEISAEYRAPGERVPLTSTQLDPATGGFATTFRVPPDADPAAIFLVWASCARPGAFATGSGSESLEESVLLDVVPPVGPQPSTPTPTPTPTSTSAPTPSPTSAPTPSSTPAPTPTPTPEPGTSPLGPVLGGLTALVLAVAAGLAFRRRRVKPPEPPWMPTFGALPVPGPGTTRLRTDPRNRTVAVRVVVHRAPGVLTVDRVEGGERR